MVNEVGCSVSRDLLQRQIAFPDANVGFGTVGSDRRYLRTTARQVGRTRVMGPVPHGAAGSFETLCAGGAVAVYGPGSAASFDIASSTWTIGPSNLPRRSWHSGVSPFHWPVRIPGRTGRCTCGGLTRGAEVIRQVQGAPCGEKAPVQKGHVFPTTRSVSIIGDDRSVTAC